MDKENTSASTNKDNNATKGTRNNWSVMPGLFGRKTQASTETPDNEESSKANTRYQHDLAIAEAMRRGGGNKQRKTTKKKKELTESDILLGLDGLDKAEALMMEQETSVENLEEALKISRMSIELLLEFLRSDPSVLPSVSRDVVSSRVASALTTAEEMKKHVQQRTQQGEGDFPATEKVSAAAVATTNTAGSTQHQSKKESSSSPVKALADALRGVLSSKSGNMDNTTKQPAGQSTSSSPSSPASNNRIYANVATKKISTNRDAANVRSNATTVAKTNRSRPTHLLKNQDQNLVKIVKSDLYVDHSQLNDTSWDDIAGLEQAKQSLQEAAILPLMRPDLFTGLRKPRHLLLYGPPGTGKTMLVKAIAKESQCLLFVCTSAALTSKWHGEGEKLLKTLFEVARAAAPSIIFVDEVDALLSSRKSDGGEHEASRRFKTEFMTQVDGVVSGDNSDNDGKNLLLIACTNCPWDIDSAVLRRFPRRIYIPLPDTKTRNALLKKLLNKAGKHNLSSSDMKAIVKRLHGFSGSDIASIASEASFGPLRSLGGMDAIRGAKAADLRPISKLDFDAGIDQATKSVSKQQLEKYDDWIKNQAAT